jgi:hypothetical protein
MTDQSASGNRLGSTATATTKGGGLLPYGIGAAAVLVALVVWKVARRWSP